MGWFHSVLRSLKRTRGRNNDTNILLFGPDGVGKTSILHNLHTVGSPTLMPRIGIDMETVKHKNIKFDIWEAGTHSRVDSLSSLVDAIVLVIDSADLESVEKAKSDMGLHFPANRLKGIPLLILATKQDLSTAVDVSVLAKQLGFTSNSGIEWFMCPCSGLTGEGLEEGMEWLMNTLRRLRQTETARK